MNEERLGFPSTKFVITFSIIVIILVIVGILIS